MSIYRNIKQTIRRAHPKMIEAFYAFYADSDDRTQKELRNILQVSERGIRKRIEKMTSDEINIYWGVLGGRVHMVYEDAKKGMNYKSMQQMIQTWLATKISKDEALRGDHIQAYATKENFKYMSHLSTYQNSRWYLANKDYKYLSKNAKARRKIADFEDKESDYTIFFKITTGGVRLLKYMSRDEKMDFHQAFILQSLAANDAVSINYNMLLDQTVGVMTKISADRAIRKLVNRKLIYSFGEKEGRSFELSSQGQSILNDALEHASETIYQS